MTTAASTLKERILTDMKAAMKSGDKARLATVRLMLAAIKQQEVDERIQLDDTRIIAVLDKMVKQRRESIRLYDQAGRTDLADAERAELEVVQAYLPQPLSEIEIQQHIDSAIAETRACGIGDMGKVMSALKPRIQGRADLSLISNRVRSLLSR